MRESPTDDFDQNKLMIVRFANHGIKLYWNLPIWYYKIMLGFANLIVKNYASYSNVIIKSFKKNQIWNLFRLF